MAAVTLGLGSDQELGNSMIRRIKVYSQFSGDRHRHQENEQLCFSRPPIPLPLGLFVYLNMHSGLGV